MRIDLNAKIRTSDGKDAGTVQRVLFDPQENTVSGFLVSTGGLLGKDVEISREDLESATHDGDVLRLDLTKDELEELAPFAASDYAGPPAGWAAPGAFMYPTTAYLFPTNYSYEAYRVPPEGNQEHGPSIAEGMAVRDKVGDEIGAVREVRLDRPSGELRGLLVECGSGWERLFGKGDSIEVAGADVVRVAEGAVHLRSAKEELEVIRSDASR